jgi:hypothetical protein
MAKVVISKVVDGVETILAEFDTEETPNWEAQVEQINDNSEPSPQNKDGRKARKPAKSK